MTTDPILFWLGVAMAVVALALLLSASLMLGRKLADHGYQQAAGLNGVRRIQSVINIRTHGNRVALGLVFLIAAFLIVFDLELWWRTLVTRSLIVTLLLGYTVSSVLDWGDEDAQMRILLKESPDGEPHHPAEGKRP